MGIMQKDKFRINVIVLCFPKRKEADNCCTQKDTPVIYNQKAGSSKEVKEEEAD